MRLSCKEGPGWCNSASVPVQGRSVGLFDIHALGGEETLLLTIGMLFKDLP